MAVLDSLRSDPETTCRSYSFNVDGGTMVSNPMGGGCSVSSNKVNDQVYELRVKSGGKDFFFPYMNAGTGGVGECIVPVGQPDGTLALTGSMNGCAFQANRTNAGFVFYHDSDGKSLAKRGNVPGQQVCRVEYSTYAGPLLIGERKMIDINNDGSGSQAYFQHCVLVVHHEGKWKVFVTGLHSITSLDNPKKKKLVPFTPHIVACMASFADV